MKLNELCLEITNQCLLECIHCSSSSSPNQTNYLDRKTIFRVIDEFERLEGEELEISGGEPLLHPNIWEILEYCKHKPFHTTLYTSGIAKESIHELVRKIDVDKVAVSLHGTRETTKEITGSDCYEKVKEFIKSLREKGRNVDIYFVLMKQNYKDFEYLVEECEKIKVENIKVLRLMPQGRARENWEKIHLSELEVKEFLNRLYDVKTNIRIEIGNPFKLYLNERTICKAGINTCLINSNGDVYPCPALKTKHYLSAGNIHENSLEDIWKKGFENLRNFKRMVKSSYCLAPWIVNPEDIIA